jgi:biotin transport system substrate-specific component
MMTRAIAPASVVPARTLPRWLGQGLAVIGASAVLALSAQIAVPALPVPITMQSLAVLAVGVTMGPRLGAAAVLAYLAEGAAGLPVFANFTGTLAHLTGPTGGYLVSFVPTAWLAGRLTRTVWGRTAAGSFATYMAGHTLILGLGAAYLSLSIGTTRAIALGVMPFLVGSVVKSLLGAAIGVAMRSRRGQA